MLITTMNDIPGHEITDVYGEVFGLTVRSRNAFSQLGAGLKSILGGELKGMTKALADSPTEGGQRLTEEGRHVAVTEALRMEKLLARARNKRLLRAPKPV